MAAKKALTFEQMMAQLEELVAAMENGSMPLEDVLLSYEKAMELSKKLDEMLKKGQARILELTKDGALEPLDQEDLK